MVRQMSISETRKRITSLENDMSYEDTISVTNHGKEVFAILKWETYESIAETLDILSEPDGFTDLRIGIAQAQEGNTIDFEDFKKTLNV